MNHIKAGLARLVGLHRTALVVGTALLSIAASRVAESGHEVGSWSLLAAGAALVAWSDLARDLNERAARLSTSSDAPVMQARRDIVMAAAGVGFVAPIALFLLGLVVAVILL